MIGKATLFSLEIPSTTICLLMCNVNKYFQHALLYDALLSGSGRSPAINQTIVSHL